MQQYYLEYQILNNRPGLLGDVASLIGMLRINIKTVSSIAENRRGFLLKYENEGQLDTLYTALLGVGDLKVKIFRQPGELDYLTLRHGKRIRMVSSEPPVFRFHRDDLDYLIDFLGGRLAEKLDILVGIRGTPRVGKTETAIAAAVRSSNPWILISSTLQRKIVRTNVDEKFLREGGIVIVDAITTFQRSFPEHIEFVKKLLCKPVRRLVEHPDVLIRETDEIRLKDFDLIVELYCPDDHEEKEVQFIHGHGFSTFDIS